MHEHGTKTTLVFLPANGKASWWLLPSLVSFHDADHLLYYWHVFVFLFHTFLFLYISFQETGHGKNTNPSLFIQVAKFQQNEWKEKSRGIRLWALNMLLGQLIVLFCSFFLDDFTIWFCSTSKILIC